MQHKSNLFVVAGTDTEVGKTTATCALLVALRRSGLTVRGIKPVESGTETQARREDEDGRRLAKAAGQTEPSEALQRLAAPLAPPVAARDEDITLAPESWIDSIRQWRSSADITLVEGAGGLLSPLARDFDSRALAKALDAPVLLVAADSLGTLNHTFLTVEALELAGCELAGIVFSAPEIPDASTGRNAAVIARRFEDIPVITLPRIADDEQGADVFERDYLPYIERS